MRAALAGSLWLVVALGAGADTRALIVAGLGGSEHYEVAFQRQAKAAADALRAVSGDVTLLLGEMTSRERLQRELAELGERAAVADALLLVLIGHGSFDDRDYRFNVPGPDVTGAELSDWLTALPASRQLVVAATSASGALQPVLAGAGRTVMTATRSGGENNASVFAGYFVAALEDPGADLDKDGYVSGQEAFSYAEDRVAEHYADANQMASEHPLTQGPPAAEPLARLEHVPVFAPGGPADDRVAALEAAIDALRADKDNRDSDSYYAELQRLLLELALARRRPGSGEAP